MFQPDFPGYNSSEEISNVISALKSLIELISFNLTELNPALGVDESTGLTAIFTKLTEDACKWVRTHCQFILIESDVYLKTFTS